MAELKEYKVLINGIEHTMQLDEAGAKRYGVTSANTAVKETADADAEAQAAADAKAAEDAAAKAEAEAKAAADAKQSKPENKSGTPATK